MLRLRQSRPLGLEPLDLDVDSGECIAVQGPSGSGKTMLLRAVADLDPCPGELSLDDTPWSAMSGPQWRRRVMYVAADSGWWDERVADHLDDWPRLVRTIGSLGLPPDCDGWPVDRLSTGERQRLALLRALERQPRVLLLDEPTAALNDAGATAVEGLLDTWRRDGGALLWVTHDAAQAQRVAGRRLTLGGGRAVAA